MNILFSFGNIINPNKGGTERVTYLTATHLQTHGHLVYYLATEEPSSPCTGKNQYFLPQNLTLNEKRDYIYDFCKKFDIDVIINEAGTTDDIYFLSKECVPANVKVITCIHFDIFGDITYFYSDYNFSFSGLSLRETIFKCIQIMRLPFLKRMHFKNKVTRYQYAQQNADYVVVPAETLVEQFKNITNRHNCRNVLCIPNPNSVQIEDTDVFENKEKLVIYVGRLSYEKRIDRILNAWIKLAPIFSDWRLEIVGDGQDKVRLLSIVKEKSIPRIRFLGTRTDILDIYKKASILALTSNHESFSMVLLEALSNGCYPILYDFPAAKQLLKSKEWGTLIKSHSERDFLRELTSILFENKSNKNEHKHIMEHLHSFHIDIIGAHWKEIIKK